MSFTTLFWLPSGARLWQLTLIFFCHWTEITKWRLKYICCPQCVDFFRPRGPNESICQSFLFRAVNEICWLPIPVIITSLKLCYLLVLWQLKPSTSIRHLSEFFFLWRCGPTRAMASSFLRFLDHKQRRITVGRTPLDEWAARRRDLYLTTHNTHNRQTSMRRWDSNPRSQQASGRRPTP